MSFKAKESGVYPQLCFLFHVDIQAAFIVLKLAFPEHGPLGIGKQGYYLLCLHNSISCFWICLGILTIRV